MELWYRKPHGAAKCAIVAVPPEHRRLISETAQLAKQKLEENLKHEVVIIDYKYLGDNVNIIE